MKKKKEIIKKPTKLLTNELVGIGRSQAEELCIALLRINFPKLKIERNDKSILGRQEIDIHLVDYKIAIEVQGITHYKSVYGAVRFAESQERDARKKARLYELNYTLIEIDISNYTKENLYIELKKEMNNIIIPKIKYIIMEYNKQHSVI